MYIFPNPLILKAKIDGHIIEQQRPPLKNAKRAIYPVLNKPISMAVNLEIQIF